ncbi:MAG: hypothetical protein EXS35_05320 [Pedosphaera sp.]|nr:hypothetical protein [Pedosphaera sp.]
MPEQDPAARFPIRLGDAKTFTLVRELFRATAFDEPTLGHVLQLTDMSALGRVRWEEIKLENLSAPLRWCLNLFVRGLSSPEKESRAVCGDEILAAFLALGLLRPRKGGPGALVCPVWLYPVDGFLVASDRTSDPDGGEFKPAEDVVFPAIYGGTLRFLKLLPEMNGGEALDLCGGTGIGALRLARTAKAAATADLAERSAFFAEFNAALNGVAMESLCGDVYAPAAGRQFDVIAAHPPFVPATGPNMVYRDGGATGEEVTRRVIEGLPAHLRPGGTCVILCVARDTQEQTFEQRAHDWLGPAAGEFDVIFGLEKILSVGEVVESLRARGQNLSDEAAKSLLVRLQSLGTRQFVYGALVIRRDVGAISPKPYRIGLTPNGRAADFERLFAWRRQQRQPGFAEWLHDCRPHFAPRLQLTARHVVQDGELVPAEFVFSIEAGLEAALRPDAWVVPLVARFNGARSVREVFHAAQKADELPAGFRLEDFAGLVNGMIGRGFLEVELPLVK